MSPEAEALSRALGESLYGYPNAPATEQDIARVVVEELGITGECSCELSEGQCAHATRRELAAFTLLELAGAKE